MKHFLTMAVFLFFSSTLFSQVWDNSYPTQQLRLWKTVELNDGQLVSTGTTAPVSIFPGSTGIVNTVLVKTTKNGALVKAVNIGQGFAYDLQFMGVLFGVVDNRIVCYDTELRPIWARTLSNEVINRIRPLSNGNLVTLSTSGANSIIMSIVNSQNGSIVMRQQMINSDTLPIGRLPEFAVIKDNIYAIVNDSIWKISSQTGKILSKLPFGSENLFEITAAADQTLLISKGEAILFKVDTLGRQIWKQDIKHKSWSNTLSKEILVVNEVNNGRSSGEITLLDLDGHKRWFRAIGDKNYENPFQARTGLQTSDGSFVISGNTFLGSQIVAKIVKLDNDNHVYLNRIVGNAYFDKNANCKKDADDIPRANWTVFAKDQNGYGVWSLTDSLGQFTLRCDTGIMDIKLVEPIIMGRKWQSCMAQSKRFVGVGNTDSLNLFQTFIDCAVLNTDIALGLLRPCRETAVIVNYSNLGSINAENASISVQLDSKLEFINASKHLISQQGLFYKFNIGRVLINERNSFIINVRVKCRDTVLLGQSICVRADIFADSICSNSEDWQDANLSVSGTCEQDSVAFVIKNTGRSASQSRQTMVIENEFPKPIVPIQLASQASIIRRFPANGHTWRMTIEQEPNHPTSYKPTAYVEGCSSNPSQIISTGFVSQFAFDDNSPTVAQTCVIVRNSFDPNDKTGYPLGYGNNHLIDQNQNLTYKIRFQNTGNDTAFKIVIRDTIDTRYLDMESIQFGASSHKYMPMLYDKNILQFTFDNILLPDSFRNEPASNGFVQFKIKQKKDLPIGTKIENSAGIYFDFNAPIVTNLATHTIGKSIFNSVKTLEINDNIAEVEVSPNPFEAETNFIIKGHTPLSMGGVFSLFDLNGRLLRHVFYDKNVYKLERKNLNSGMYIYKIQTKEGLSASGKIIVF